MVKKTTLAILAAAGVMGATASAKAGGLYFTDRGVRPLGRGGAFVAGADDAGSIAYNPAGLAFTGHQFLLGRVLAAVLGDVPTQGHRPPGGSQHREPTGQEWKQTFPSVDGTTPVLPIPTIVYADNLGVENFNFALGVWAPVLGHHELPGDGAGPARAAALLDHLAGRLGAWPSPACTPRGTSRARSSPWVRAWKCSPVSSRPACTSARAYRSASSVHRSSRTTTATRGFGWGRSSRRPEPSAPSCCPVTSCGLARRSISRFGSTPTPRKTCGCPLPRCSRTHP